VLVAQLELVLRIVLAALVGGLVGLERELRGRDPGIRTHAVVAVGAALFTIAGAYGFSDLDAASQTDPTRVAAQVAAGIGFIGAGAMLRSGLSIRGLTTAATLWLSAAIGVSAGAATYAPLLGALVVSMFVLVGVRVVKPRLLARWPSRHKVLAIEYERGHGTLGPVMRGLHTAKCHVSELLLDDDDEDCAGGPGVRRARIAIHAPDEGGLKGLLDAIHRRPEVRTVSLERPALVGFGGSDPETAVLDDNVAYSAVAISPTATIEVELQYVHRGDGTAVVPVVLAGLPLVSSQRVDLNDIYFDTADLDLRRSRCTLRVRCEADREPRLVWKGPSQRRPDGAKTRDEREFVLAATPVDGTDLLGALERSGLRDAVSAVAGQDALSALGPVGELRNTRSIHVYGDEILALELVWDHLQYPVGPTEVRVEVEAKTPRSSELLALADRELRHQFGRALEPPRRGKASELCARLESTRR
jgi:putative Mg2+ transporter-C (MgtC) family protein